VHRPRGQLGRPAQLRPQRRARQHEHVLLERPVEPELVGPGGVVEREVSRLLLNKTRGDRVVSFSAPGVEIEGEVALP
jgi:hypothetical protein